jgi:exodeoxyribonuclease VII large subunit
MLRTQLQAHIARGLEMRSADIKRLMGILDSLSPLKVVERGYSIARKEGKLIKASSQLKAGDAVELQFAKGKAEAKIEKVIS